MIAEWMLFAAFIAVLLRWFCTKGSRVDKDVPECSRSLPFIGVTHMLIGDTTRSWETIKILDKDATQQGGVTKTTFGLLTHYLITDPDDAATVANNCLEKHFVYNMGESWLGQSLFTGCVPLWKVHRKLLSPAFTLPIIHGFVESFNKHANELTQELENVAETGPFKATQYINTNILRGVCTATVGDSNIHDKKTIADYSNAIKEITNLLAQKVVKIWLQNDLIFKLSGWKKEEDKFVKIIVDVSDKIIETAKKEIKNQENANRQIGGTTFLDKYLGIKANNALTDRELREEVNLIVLAAFDTTSIELELILILLGSHPEVQERVYQEIMSVIGPKADIHKDHLQNLVYTDAVIKESIRLYPALPIVGRTIKQTVQLRNYTLREGTYAVLSLYGINRHPSWGPDADQFRPERWLEPGGIPNIGNSIPTFSIGKRNCIGKMYAMTALKVYVAQVVRRYLIEADYTNLILKWDLVLTPAKGNEISLKLRNKP